jgi:beta-glucosidase
MMELNDKTSIKGLIAEMTLEEKLGVLTGASMFTTPALERLGIPSIYYLDGGTGANYMQMVMDIYFRLNPVKDANVTILEGSSYDLGKFGRIINCMMKPALSDSSNENLNKDSEEIKDDIKQIQNELESYVPNGQLPGCFPPGIVFGATWDPNNIYEAGRALGKEAHYYGIDVLLGSPNVNIHRDPLGGRLFEGYSEDPCLVSKLAPEFVKGIQDEGIIANVKHYAANNQETDRRTINEHIPERVLHEIYFPGFKACIQEGGCKSVMSAYNAINGKFCALNKWLLVDILRNEWGFKGFVVSDWGAAYDQIEAWDSGNDVDMPGPRPIDSVVSAVKTGKLDEKKIDESLERYLNIVLETPAMKGRKYTSIDRKGSSKAAYESIKEGMVLLKNNDVLPFSNKSNLCFWGSHSKRFIESGGGSANVYTGESTSMYDTVIEKLGESKVSFEDIRPDTNAVIITATSMGQEGFDRSSFDVDDKEMVMEAIGKAKASNKKIVIILNICGPVDVSDYEADADAILCVFIPGMEGGRAAAEVLLGEINPSGKLPVTFPKKYDDCPSSDNFPGRGKNLWYGEGLLVGYRYYDYRNVEPRYPFGFGLSYTNFKIISAVLLSNKIDLDKEGDNIVLNVIVKNTGHITGKEVVQVYISQKNPTIFKPLKELKAFKKIEIKPGEEKNVEIRLTKKDLESYDDQFKKWQAEPDEYQIMVGTSSQNITHILELDAEGWNPNGFGANSSLSEIYAVPQAMNVLTQFAPVNSITKEEIALALLFKGTESIGKYWKDTIEPKINESIERKEVIFKSFLKEINKYHRSGTPVKRNL